MRENSEKRSEKVEVSSELFEKVKQIFIDDLRHMVESDAHPSWKEAARELVEDLEAGRPSKRMMNRLFPEILGGAIESAGIKRGPEFNRIYEQIWRKLESPDTQR